MKYGKTKLVFLRNIYQFVIKYKREWQNNQKGVDGREKLL